MRSAPSCETQLTCMTREDTTLYATVRTSVIVEGTGDHTIQVRRGTPLGFGAECGPADPFRFCDTDFVCDDGVCVQPTIASETSPCACMAPFFLLTDPGQTVLRTTLPALDPRWVALSFRGGAEPTGIRLTPRADCPPDLVVAVHRDDVPCDAGCTRPETSLVERVAIGDGSTCLAHDLVGVPIGIFRLRVESAIGGPLDLEIDTF